MVLPFAGMLLKQRKTSSNKTRNLRWAWCHWEIVAWLFRSVNVVNTCLDSSQKRERERERAVRNSTQKIKRGSRIRKGSYYGYFTYCSFGFSPPPSIVPVDFSNSKRHDGMRKQYHRRCDSAGCREKANNNKKNLPVGVAYALRLALRTRVRNGRVCW